jgi:hypothetical protein
MKTVHDKDCDRTCVVDLGTGKMHSLRYCTCKCGINLYEEWLRNPNGD